MKALLALSLLTAVLFSNTTTAQSPIDYIPADSKMVLVFNSASITKHLDLKSLQEKEPFSREREYFEEMVAEGRIPDDELMYMICTDPKGYGMDVSQHAYISFDINDTINTVTMVFGLADQVAYAQKVKSAMGASFDSLSISTPKFTAVTSNEMTFAWNEKIGMVTITDVSYRYRSQEVESVIDPDLDWEQRWEMEEQMEVTLRNRVIGERLESLFTPNVTNSFANGVMWKEMKQNDFDVAFCLSTNGYVNQYQREMDEMFAMMEELGGDPASGNQALRELRELYDGNYTYYYAKFEPGKVKMETVATVNDKLLKHTKAINSAKMNKKFNKYIPKNALGFSGVAFNPEGLGDMWEEVYMPTMEAIPMLGTYYSNVLRIFGALLDEDALYDWIQGNAVVVLNDIRDVETTYTTYDYDENFNYVETVKTKNETLPIYTAMVGMGNDEITPRLLDMMETIPDVRNEGDYYVIPASVAEMEMYVAWYDDVLIITNDKKLVTDHLKSGLPSSERLGKDGQKLLKKNNFVGYFNSPETFKKLGQIDEIVRRDEDRMMMETIQNTFGMMTLTGLDISGNSATNTMEMEVKDDSANSMKVIWDFMFRMVELERGN